MNPTYEECLQAEAELLTDDPLEHFSERELSGEEDIELDMPEVEEEEMEFEKLLD